MGTSAIGVLAKIESADSVEQLDAILDAADGAMVARGDLGAELPVRLLLRVGGWMSGVLDAADGSIKARRDLDAELPVWCVVWGPVWLHKA